MMRCERAIRLTLSAVLLLAGPTGASACPLDEMRHKLERADEHVFWFDFWLDLDAREAQAELGYARADYAAVAERLQERDCRDTPAAVPLTKIAQKSLATCTQWSRALDGNMASLRVRD